MKTTLICKSILTLSFLLGFHSLKAQTWEYHKDFPVNIAPLDIDANEEGTLFMLTQDNRLFYKFIDGEWTEMMSGWASGGTGFNPISPMCITAVKSSTRLVVGDSFSGGIYTTADYGLNWTQTFLTTSPITGFHESITALSPAYNNNLFFGAAISGLQNQVVRYTNGGTNGTLLNFDPSNNPANSPVKLHLAANGALLIGTFNGGIIASFDNGNSFQPTTQNQHEILSYAEDANGRVYALAHNVADGFYQLIYSDDYMNWQSTNLPNDAENFTTIFCHPDTDEIWLGSETGLYVRPITSINWADAALNNGSFWTIELTDDHNGHFFCFSAEHIAQSLNGAATTWIPEIAGLTGTATQVIFGEDERIFAANNYFSNNISVAQFAAAPWANVRLGGETSGVRHLFVRPESKVFANTGFALHKSIDNGLTYTDISPVVMPGYIRGFHVGEAGALFVNFSGEVDALYWSQDDGTTWEFLHTFPSSFPFFPDEVGSIAQDSEGVIYVTMNSFDFENGPKIYFSTDAGQTWETATYNDDEPGNSGMAVFSRNNLTYAQMIGSIYTFDYTAGDDGFTSVPLPEIFSQEQLPLMNFRVNDLGQYYVFAYTLYASTDGGATWQNLQKPSPVNTVTVDDITFDQAQNPYLVTTQTVNPADRGIYRVDFSLSANSPNQSSNIRVYPNPASDLIRIDSSEPFSEIAIFSLTGQQMMVIETFELNQINISHLPPGMYLLKIQHEDGGYAVCKIMKGY